MIILQFSPSGDQARISAGSNKLYYAITFQIELKNTYRTKPWSNWFRLDGDGLSSGLYINDVRRFTNLFKRACKAMGAKPQRKKLGK